MGMSSFSRRSFLRLAGLASAFATFPLTPLAKAVGEAVTDLETWTWSPVRSIAAVVAPFDLPPVTAG